jgi:Uma2 family endonuclease
VRAQPAASGTAPQPSLLTVAEFLALGETELGHEELVEGRVVMSPGPGPDHNSAAVELLIRLRAQLPPHLEVLLDLDVDLQLAPPDAPGSTRRPDLLVARRTARERVRAEGGIIRAREVVLVAEVVSPGSVRTDTVHKRNDYADAGIPHYWILDLGVPVSLLACHLAGEFGYQDAGPVTGTYTAAEPFALTIELDALR